MEGKKAESGGAKQPLKEPGESRWVLRAQLRVGFNTQQTGAKQRAKEEGPKGEGTNGD